MLGTYHSLLKVWVRWNDSRCGTQWQKGDLMVFYTLKATIFLLVDLRDYFSDFGEVGGGGGGVNCHFQSFFLITPEKTVKIVR